MSSDDSIDDAQERAQFALAEATRRVIAEVRATRAPVEVLEEARRALEQAAARLEPHRYEGGYAQADLLGGVGRFEQTDDPMEYFPYSPFVGRGNPISLPVEFVGLAIARTPAATPKGQHNADATDRNTEQNAETGRRGAACGNGQCLGRRCKRKQNRSSAAKSLKIA